MSNATSDLARFWSKVDQSGECWLWTASTERGRGTNRYGQFWATGKLHRAHRWIYGQLREPLVPGLTIDHLCGTTLCVRPDHLEQVTHQTNILRSAGPAAKNAAMTHCPRGHALDEANTMIRLSGKRRCRLCHLAEQTAHSEKQKRARAAAR